MYNQCQETVLANGLTIVTQEMPVMNSVSLGFWIGAGSRYENSKNSGISHFLEHLLFKGSKKRSGKKIKEAIEGIGGSLNGFTAEECTCYLARIMSEKFSLAFDVLMDMVLQPVLDKKEIEREKGVVKEEINMKFDLPMHYVHALFDQLLWPNQPLGYLILGTTKNISSFQRENLVNYCQKFYQPQNMVIAVAGNISHQKVIHKSERTFGTLPKARKIRFLPAKERQSQPQLIIKFKETEQTHLCLGTRALSRNHPDKYILAVLNILLGGNMSSRLFEEVREKRGLAYEISSYLNTFADTGSFVISAGVDPKKAKNVIQVALKELVKIKAAVVGQRELKRAKEFCIGQFLLALEDTANQMHWLGENKLCLGRIPNVTEVLEGVNKVTSDNLQRLARKLFTNNNLNLAVIGPHKNEKELKGVLSID